MDPRRTGFGLDKCIKTTYRLLFWNVSLTVAILKEAMQYQWRPGRSLGGVRFKLCENVCNSAINTGKIKEI